MCLCGVIGRGDDLRERWWEYFNLNVERVVGLGMLYVYNNRNLVTLANTYYFVIF